jgi:uncharacterized protein YcfJ
MKSSFKIALSLALAAATLAATADSSFARSRRGYCAAYARDAARHVGGEDVATGLVVGAGAGGLVGALAGHNSFVPGLAIGAVGGTMVGAVSASEKKRRVYDHAYYHCMNGGY